MELYNKEESTREQVFKNFLTKFSPYYRINESEIHKGVPPKIQIVTELKIGRKVVTRVSNFETFDIRIENLAKELRNKCSGSSTIVDNDVQVQGPHGKLIIDLLKDKGVPVSYINFEDKTKKKRAKNRILYSIVCVGDFNWEFLTIRSLTWLLYFSLFLQYCICTKGSSLVSI